ncbi:hypothetical protein LCGC14_0888780 [marine sediment metagenome]|uniref:Uncharacterized protein n=1 Tax=marine sediment metagenome TaxID=412755 RepID=A0A0F9NZW0_9ZZZZ
MQKSPDTSEIDNLLKSAVKNIKIENRQFRVFSYNTFFNHIKLKDLKNLNLDISKERALFPSMNPNLFGGLPSIFSCKPSLRVSLNPGDVIFCFPKSSYMEEYFKLRNEESPQRCITLVIIVIKKVDLQHAYEILKFKAWNISRKIIKDNRSEFMVFAPDLKQVGDITAKIIDKNWDYVGGYEDPHFHNDDREIKSLNDNSCKYRNYLYELLDHERPFTNKGCKRLSCKTECSVRPGTWKYDILFKWGLLGSLKKGIPLNFRSFYLGSKGWPLKDFADRIGAPNLCKNARWHRKEFLNKNGPDILQKLREDFNIN